MRRAPKPCIVVGCPRYAADGVSRCDQHQREHLAHRFERGLTGSRGSRPGHRRRRDETLERQALCDATIVPRLFFCAGCGAPFPASGLELHHVDGDPTNDAAGNLEMRCHDCHVRAQSTLTEARRLRGAPRL